MTTKHIRYQRDKELQAELLERPTIQRTVKKIDELYSGYGVAHTRKLFAHSVRLHEEIHPGLFKSLNQTKEALNFDKPVRVFISQSPQLNGYCFVDSFGNCNIGLTSSIIEKFKDDELAFVLGHELGHLIFKHNDLPMPATALLGSSKGKLVSLKDAIDLFVCRHFQP